MAKRIINMESAIGIILVLFFLTYPLYASPFQIGLVGKFIVLILFAISLDLIWGYTGLLSLGHAVFFGLGGYILALSYTFQKGVPMFMQRFGIEEIPFWMSPLKSVQLGFLLGLLIPSLLAALMGYFIFKSRVSGVYFSIMTLAFVSLFELLIINLQAYTGGFNGLTGLPRFPVFGEPLDLIPFYYLIVVITVMIYSICRMLTKMHFGKVLRAIRENEDRVSFLSYEPANYKIFIFTLSGLIAGLAGMLYVSLNGFVSPKEIGVGLSISVILWVAIGGRGYLMGAVIGTLLMNWLSNSLSEQYPSVWQLLTGIAMILVVMFLPDGLYGTIKNRLSMSRK